MTTWKPLADGFPAAHKSDWEHLAGRRETGIAALRWRSPDGIPIGPIYPPAHGATRAPQWADGSWTIVEQVTAEAAADVEHFGTGAKNGGSSAVEFLFIPKFATYCLSENNNDENRTNWNVLVSNVINSRRSVWLDAGLAGPRLMRTLDDSSIVHAICDPVSEIAMGAPVEAADVCFSDIAALIRAGGSATAITADGRRWHDAGATEVQELAIAIASAVGSLRRLGQEGVPPEVAWQRLGMRLAADADQFLTIAKFRAIRLLVARIGEIAAVTGHPPVHAETSWRMLGAREPTMNLVRVTTAAFAAAAGGADAITVLSPMLDDARFSARMARNVQLILKDESSLDGTADPGAGSGAVEDLTERLAAEAWDLFTRIEADGGLAAVIRAGSIIGTVAAARDARLEAVARRRLPMVGVNVNLDPEAPPPPPLPEAAKHLRGENRLRPIRLAEPFERLAARFAVAMAGEPATLARFGRGGDPALADALAAVGLRARSVRSAEEVAVGARLACLVVGDDGAESAAIAAARLRAAGTRVIVAATTLPDVRPPWCDAIVTPDCDLIALFSGLLDRIAERQEKEQG